MPSEELVVEDVDETFPFPSYRPGQEEALKEATKAIADGEDVVLQGAVGVGKSGVAISLARWVDSCVITTPLNSLVDQYYEDFGDMQGVEVVKGRRNYRCYHEDDDGGDWDGDRTCDHCPCQWDPELITMVTDNPETQACRCDYAKAKRRAMRTPVVMTNLHMAMLAPFVSDDHDLLIIDEGHNLESVIANHVTANIDPFEFETHPPDTDNWPDHYDWVRKKGLPEARENFENFKNLVENRNQTDEDTVDKLNKWERIKRRLKWLQSDYKKNNEDWIVLRDDYNDKVTYKPVTGTRFIENRLYDIADNVLLMSATPPTRDEVALSGARKVTAPMHFPKENRPIKFDYRGSMTYEERGDSYSDIAQGIKDVQEGKTLIHAHAYSIANELYDELAKIGADVTMQDRYNREESLQNWIESDNNIFLSVNMTEGIDLKGDKCRTQVLVKTPWPNFGDDWVQARKEKLGWGKISHRVTRDIVQAYGRAIRSADDEATFYIMDSNFEKFWKRNQKRFPDWFVEAIDYDEVRIT